MTTKIHRVWISNELYEFDCGDWPVVASYAPDGITDIEVRRDRRNERKSKYLLMLRTRKTQQYLKVWKCKGTDNLIDHVNVCLDGRWKQIHLDGLIDEIRRVARPIKI